MAGDSRILRIVKSNLLREEIRVGFSYLLFARVTRCVRYGNGILGTGVGVVPNLPK